jgi:predicted nucleotidyltransferase
MATRTDEQFGLSPRHWQQIHHVLRHQPRIQSAWIFGSRATGGYRPGSDLDIAVYGESLTFMDYLRLMLAFDECWLPLRIDLLWLQKDSDKRNWTSVKETGKPILLSGEAA